MIYPVTMHVYIYGFLNRVIRLKGDERVIFWSPAQFKIFFFVGDVEKNLLFSRFPYRPGTLSGGTRKLIQDTITNIPSNIQIWFSVTCEYFNRIFWNLKNFWINLNKRLNSNCLWNTRGFYFNMILYNLICHEKKRFLMANWAMLKKNLFI